MSSENISVIALEPFVSKFVFAIIQNIGSHNFSYEERPVIHADLVPRVSERVSQSSLKEKEVPSVKKDVEELVVPVSNFVVEIPVDKPVVEIPVVKVPVSKPVVEAPVSRPVPVKIPIHKPVVEAPVSRPIPVQTPIKRQVLPLLPRIPPQQTHVPPPQLSRPPQMPAIPHPLPVPPRQIHIPPHSESSPYVQPISHKVTAPSVSGEMESGQDYGRIAPLLNDPVVSLIECQGAGKPVMIIRAGQRQITRITLSPEEIKEILQEASDEAHIPLLDGVFRAVVDNFSINAIISEMVGSKFVIRKQTPYSLLERQV